MKNKILFLLIFCMALISIASVCAAELTKENDFDGLFKMKVTESDNFTQLGDPNAYSSLLYSSAAYKNNNDTIFVLYYDDIGINRCIEIMSYESIKVDDTVNEGNLTLFNSTPEMNDNMDNYTISTFAALTGQTGNHDSVVVIGGTNETLVKEYANTVQFE